MRHSKALVSKDLTIFLLQLCELSESNKATCEIVLFLKNTDSAHVNSIKSSVKHFLISNLHQWVF